MKSKLIDMINNLQINLNEIKKLVDSMENDKEINTNNLVQQNIDPPVPVVIVQDPPINKISTIINKGQELIDFVNNDQWENAIPPDLICDENNHEDKMDRARGIRDIFYPNFDYQNKKILDLGTGYGHLVAAIAENNPSIVVGYDIRDAFQIQTSDKAILTVDWNIVAQKGPYDLIFIYDVLDHVERESPKEILNKASSVLAPNGSIRMRCHPFISKHGGHVYTKINKSYAHLVLTKDELASLGHDFKNYPTIQVRTPVMTYTRFINDANLKIVDQKTISESIDVNCTRGIIAERIKKNMGLKNLMVPQMGMQFLDFTLTK